VELSKYIKEILISRDNVIVSGFGAFEKLLASAKIDPVTNEMYPPQITLIFRPELTISSGVLDKFVAEKESVTEEKANELILSAVQEWQNTLQSGQNLILESLGTLSKNESGEYNFVASVQASDFPESYGLPVIPVLEKSTGPVPPIKKEEEKKPVEQKIQEKKIPEKKIPEKKPEQKKVLPHKKPIKTVVKTENQGTHKSHKKLIIGLIIGIPVAALIVLGALNFSLVKQKVSSTWNYLTTSSKNDKGSVVLTDSLKTDSTQQNNNLNAETQSVIENFTIVNSETNARIDPKTDQLSSVKKVYIIAGSYKVKSFASRQKKILNNKGFKAEVLPVNQGLYRVSVASFNDMARAAKDFDHIKSIDESLDFWILIDR
jgi:nucleoid DNA-binding protein/cell division protein FtsN